MPGFRRARRRADGPEDYIEKFREGKLRDPVIGFQFANGFAPIGVLADYLPDDQASCGFAAPMVWRNPYVDPHEPPSFRVPRAVASVRLAPLQLQARPVTDSAELLTNITPFSHVTSNSSATY